MKVGYAVFVGRPNTGKSTLMNRIIEEELASVSNVPQTTRRAIQGIYTDGERQIICIDTPGLYNGTDEISEYLKKESRRSLSRGEVIVYLIDLSRPEWEEEEMIEALLKVTGKPIITIGTKVDLPRRNPIKTDFVINKWSDLQMIIDKITTYLPEGEPLYELDVYTNQSSHDRVAEIIREQVLTRMIEEIPHSIYVKVEDIEELPGLVRINAHICVEKDSQKRIVIGTAGKMVQDIGSGARIKIEELYGKKSYLALRVRVDKNWRKNPGVLRSLFSDA